MNKFPEKKQELESKALMKRIAELESQKKKMEEGVVQLKEKALRYELLFELSDDAILVIEDGTFTDCNQAVVKMLGYENKNQLLNTHPSELSPERQPDGRLSFEKAQEMMSLAVEKGSHHFEWIHTKANGDNFPVEVWLSSVKYKDKWLINTIWRDLTEIKKAEAKINASLTEKEILLKEIHHRVKNNLQIITSLLSLQSGMNDDLLIKEQFNTCQHRINSMAMIHEMLYQTEAFTKIEYGDYLQKLIKQLIRSIKGTKANVKVDISSNKISLNIDTAIPLGLLVNEIVTNSLKYGIQADQAGTLFVHIERIDTKKYCMTIGDDGVGFDESTISNSNNSLGLRLIKTLSVQLNGKIERDLSKKGTHYVLYFEEVY